MILKGKRILIAGMSDRRSIGFSIAQEAQREGAEILLTSFGRIMSITQMTAKKLDPVPDILEMDVTKASDIAHAAEETSKRWDRRRHGALGRICTRRCARWTVSQHTLGECRDG